MTKNNRSAAVYIAAAMPGLLVKLSISFLKMKRRGVKAEKRFYRSLREEGIDKNAARELSARYSDPLTLSYWIKTVVPKIFSGDAGKVKNKE
jgi:hypothetical protein